MFCFTFVKCSRAFPLKVLDAMMKKFVVSHPIILNTNLKISNKVALLKMLSYNGHETSFNKNHSHGYQSYIIFSELQKFKWEIHTNVPVFVVSKIQHEKEFNHINLPLDSEVYFIDETTFKLYETYSVNNIHTTRYLGQFQIQDNVIFIGSNFNPSFIKRRGNFHGSQLTAVTEGLFSLTQLPNDFKSKAIFFPNNQTYDVTDIIEGSSIDLLHSLEKLFNFSTRLYKRKDGKWGLSEKLENGTFIPTGMLENLNDGSADFGWASFSMAEGRLRHVDYLPIITNYYASVFIPKKSETPDIDWQLYFRSFSRELWGTLLSTAFIFAVFIYIMEWKVLQRPVCDTLHCSNNLINQNYSSFQDVNSILKNFWTHFMFYFSGKPLPINISFLKSYKFLLFVSLLGAVVVWISYRAFLTSELSVEIKSYPFHDLDSLSKTDYRYQKALKNLT